jgi:hypothetical protein
VSRRQGVTWAATSVPDIRRHWCTALDRTIERFSEGLAPMTDADGPGARRLERMQAKLGTEMQIMKAETQAIRDAELFWVSRDMVDMALDAAATLPEWTPALVIPAPTGLLCWAKPAATVPYGPKATATTDVPWDAVWWWTRPDGRLQLVSSSRFTKQPELIAPYQVTTPLWAANTIVLDPNETRTAEANGTEDSHPFISVVGAAWLLMSQPGVTENRTINDSPAQPSQAATPNTRQNPPVTIIELRRPTRPPAEKSDSTAERTYNRRWWVSPHWRQQACGPNHSQRRPKFILPYIKGPQDKPLTTDRVNVWRR